MLLHSVYVTCNNRCSDICLLTGKLELDGKPGTPIGAPLTCTPSVQQDEPHWA